MLRKNTHRDGQQALIGFDPPTLVGESFYFEPHQEGYRLQYQHPHGHLFQGDATDWLASLDNGSVDLVFADPPYNVKKAEWDTFESQERYIEWAMTWIQEASRVLKPTGSLFVCGLSETLADLKHPACRYFESCRWIVWHYKNKANLGKDWGRSHESLLHLRKSRSFRLRIDSVRIPYGNHTLKYPSHPQALTSNFGNGKKRDNWTPHPLGAKPKDVIEIPTTCNGSGESTPHPTQKPEELIRKLVLSSSDRGDLVIDPFSGSGTTLVVSEQLGRRWLGCDLSFDYNNWAIERIENVRRMTEQEWFEHDKANAQRRSSIR